MLPLLVKFPYAHDTARLRVWIRRLYAHSCAVLVAIALTGAAAPAFPAPPASRAEALANLKSPDTATRAEAVVWVANHGRMEDAALLQSALRDESAFVRDFAERGLWLLWGRSGERAIDELMARASDLQQAGRLGDAIEVYSEVIRRKPEFAEGWNRRATAYYLAGDYKRSIADCHEVLRRNPGHFGALSGMGQIYTQLEEYQLAISWLQRALEANPNMVGVEMQIKMLEERLKKGRQAT